MNTNVIDITCPTCGTVSYFEDIGRDAGAFCRVCDYPLFWVRNARLAAGEQALGDTGLRRLPGTAGKVALATLDCPTCTEPNPVTGVICIRCGNPLHPVAPPPVVVEAPPPPPPIVEAPPPPPPPVRVMWPWIVAGVLVVVGVLLLVGLLT